MSQTILKVGNIVFFNYTEQVWNKQRPMKRSDVYDTRSVTLRCKVVEIHGDEFKGALFGNNEFEKDGETFVFHRNNLLCDQNFKNTEELGKWW